ncbi:MAG: hypothetical protein K2Q06_16360 [Parvularculaceae bacterium]|nr:hypothetical protein [Parvularculaceae bacterium]
MRILAAACGAALALGACSRKAETASAPPESAPAAATTRSASGPVVDRAEIAPDTLWIELLGVWAPEGACGDVARAWRIEANAFHLNEMHCAVRSLVLSKAGVEASAGCVVEGFDDGATHVYDFTRPKDGKLEIVQVSNGAKYESLSLCPDAPVR